MSVVLREKIDVKEDILFELDKELLEILLKDRSSGQNIIWAVDDYQIYGNKFSANDHISIESVTGKNGEVIKPRIQKTKDEKVVRIREKAEVFTPSWVCNAQNNLIDNAWFEGDNIFNHEIEKGWKTTNQKIQFSKDKTWQDYVMSTRLEITCGEAPYLTSRYDTVTGEYIEPQDRIGLLDRKLRIISENVKDKYDWIDWAKKAVQNIYGYDWQGDNVLLARENILYAVIEYYEYIYNDVLSTTILKELAEVISWNIWQMDGLKCVIPNSCIPINKGQLELFSSIDKVEECPGCKKNDIHNHTGVYCKIMDWDTNKPIKFVSLLKG